MMSEHRQKARAQSRRLALYSKASVCPVCRGPRGLQLVKFVTENGAMASQFRGCTRCGAGRTIHGDGRTVVHQPFALLTRVDATLLSTFGFPAGCEHAFRSLHAYRQHTVLVGNLATISTDGKWPRSSHCGNGFDRYGQLVLLGKSRRGLVGIHPGGERWTDDRVIDLGSHADMIRHMPVIPLAEVGTLSWPSAFIASTPSAAAALRARLAAVRS